MNGFLRYVLTIALFCRSEMTESCPVLCLSLVVPVVSNSDFRREIVDLWTLSAFATTVTLSPASNLPRALSLMSALSRSIVRTKPKRLELSCNAVFIPPYHS